MTMKQLATEVAKREGHKSESRIGDIREVLAIVSEVLASNDVALTSLLANGKRRNKKK